MTDKELLLQFESCTLPVKRWHHREHIKIAYLYLTRYPFQMALKKMRTGLKAYNSTHHVPYTLTRGYHETITQAWFRLVHFTLCEYGTCKNADMFYKQNSHLSESKSLRFFYTRDRIVSMKAKETFVKPDIIPFPKSKRKKHLAGKY